MSELRQKILELVREYYQENHAVKGDFQPGVTKVNYGGRIYDEAEMVNLVSASLDFWLTYGKYSLDFERKLASMLGVAHALLVNSGSSANLLAFMALTSPVLKDRRIQRGDEVITVAAAFPTTVSPIIQYGAIPVFVDVELATANIDCAQLEAARSERTRAVMLAHSLGNPFNISAVKAFCQKYNLWLVEDNCDALGSRYNGQFTGTFGDIGTSSFYPPHHLTMGEGGAVYTGNPELYRILLSLRDWGRDCWCDSGSDNTCGCRFTGQFGTLPYGYDHKYVYSHLGFNLKATDLQAAIGCAQLDKLEEFGRRRRENFAVLHKALAPISEFQLLEAYQASDPSWFGFMITIKDGVAVTRNELVEHLESRLIQTRNLFAGNLTRHPCFTILREGVDYRIAMPLVNTDKIMKDSFWIGVYPGMTPEKLSYMVDTFKDFMRR